MARLSVNINKIATLRNTRSIGVPDLLRAAETAMRAGAAGITIHPRPDERHIRAADVPAVAAAVAARPGVELNIEGNPFEGRYLEHCRAVRPAQCTLVPDSAAQATSDHGWDLRRDGPRLRPAVAELRALGGRVSLFMDVDAPDLELAAAIGADRVELYTAPYAQRFAREGAAAAEPFARAAARARGAGLGVNAGHDLNLDNLPALVTAIPGLLEVSIGHALVADALEFGLFETVRRYLAAAGG